MSLRTLSAMFAIGILSGCSLTLSQHPLSDERSSKADERLIGYWEGVPEGLSKKADGTNGFLIIGVDGSRRNTMSIIMLGDENREGKQLIGTSTFAAFASPGERNFLSVNAGDLRYIIREYGFESNDRILWTRSWDQTVVLRLVREGKLAGEVHAPPVQALRPDQEPSEHEVGRESVVITEKPERLRAFLMRHPQVFAAKQQRLRRLKPERVARIIGLQEPQSETEQTQDYRGWIAAFLVGITFGLLAGYCLRRHRRSQSNTEY
ncbi:MAG: hypothetical protein ACE5KM_13250 [Planctomycetaceae bacterium]